MLFLNRKAKFHPTRHLPVAALPNNQTVFLTDESISLLRFCANGATEADAVDYLKDQNPNARPQNIIDHLLRCQLLVRTSMGSPWQGNTFGASLICDEEYEAVREVLEDKRLFRHQEVALDNLRSSTVSPCIEFERRLASLAGVRYCTALNSGTSALECGMQALGIGAGQRVIVPAYTYIGTVAAVLNVGALPIICDIDDSLMLAPEAVEKRITEDTTAIICVHIRGGAARIAELKDLAQGRGLLLIEDCAQALGTKYNDRAVGSFGDIGCLSFHQHKIITSGEGGAVVTNNSDIHERMQILSDASRLFAHRHLIPGMAGHNHRMSEIHAAIGLVQLRRLPGIASHLRSVYGVIAEAVSQSAELELQALPCREGAIPQAIYFNCETTEYAQRLAEGLVGEDIPASVLFQPGEINHDVYAYWPYVLERIGVVEHWDPVSDAVLDLCPATLDLLSRTVHIPLGVAVSDADARRCSEAIQQTVSSLRRTPC